jgi:hemoglobin/transferrin/lactoferrin receptor protein
MQKDSWSVAGIASLVALFLVVSVPLGAGTLDGTVLDPHGRVVVAAAVSVLTGDRTTVASATTDDQGRFVIPDLPAGSYLLVVSKGAFEERRAALAVGSEEEQMVSLTLRLAPLTDTASVTASRGEVETVGMTGQPVNVIAEEEIDNRARVVVVQAVEGEAGVALQRTSPTMGGVFIRGLVGNKVNVFVDGVRYSNGAQRGGVNTFLNLIEPGSLDSIEILRGPSSDQYGSDALGGTIQFLSKVPTLSSAGRRVGGQMDFSGGTAHRNGGGDGLVSFVGSRVGVVGFVSGQKVGLLRPGGGYDSHAAVTRFLGVRSDLLMDERLPDTSFDQHGESLRVNWNPASDSRIATSYVRTFQAGGDRYDQLLGGDGNLISELNGMSLDLFSLRFERLALGPFQLASINYSLNSQREERVNQGGQGSSTATIGHEPERTTVHGVSGSLVRQTSLRSSVAVGGDVHFERLTSDSFNINPTTGARSVRRPRVPHGATFRQGGVYTRASFDAVPDRVRLVGSIRVGGARYEANASDSPVVGGLPLWPDDSLSAIGVGFRAAAIFTPNDNWMFSGLVSRGFRAPHMTDLGTLGLTGSGFEVAAPDVASMNAMVGTTADTSAVSTGDAVEQVTPETSLNFEGTASYRNRIVRTDLTVFVNNVYDNIQKQALILPAGAVGRSIAGNPITSQTANGAVFVALSSIPVLVRANFDNARIWGIEQSVSAELSRSVQARTAFTYIRAEDTHTHLPPNIEGGTPAPSFFAAVRWMHSRGLYVEPYFTKRWEQTRLSSLDLGDRRTGAGRTTTSIRNFFLNGARNRGWVSNGPDGVAGNADDVLTVTGETLAQITTRVLGTATSSSLFPAIPGSVVFGARVGLRTGAHEVVVDFENLGDENYRDLSWGMDGPGRGVSVRYGFRF